MVLVLCTSPHRDLSTREDLRLIPLTVSVVCFVQNISKFSETTEPTEAKFNVASP